MKAAFALSGGGLFSEDAEPRPLRPHQVLAIAGVRRSLAMGNRRVVLQLPTGAGKTRTAAEIVMGALAKGNRVTFTVPAISLIDQTIAAFEAEGISAIGVMQANHPRTNGRQPVQVVSVQTLARRSRPESDIMIIDEVHQQHQVVIDWMKDEPTKVFIGLSATPWARGMAETWQDLVAPVLMEDLIEQGYLSRFKVYAPSHPDLSGVKTMAGDYHEGQLAEAMGNNALVADIVQTWLKRGVGLPTLVFAVNKAHAAQLVDQFTEAGVKMGYCDDSIDIIERKLLFQQMARGDLAGIVNIATLTTGVDADVRCIVLARPTKSKMLFVQMIGRGLRTADQKSHCLILDHADNHARMGFVTDIRYESLLEGKRPNSETKDAEGGSSPLPKECPSCGVLKPVRLKECPSCGFAARRESGVEVMDGDLELLDPSRSKPAKSAKKPKVEWDKQKFWSMARYIDQERGKGGKLAAALYKGKFDVWPRGLSDITTPPDAAFLSYEKSRRIAYAQSRQNANV